MFDDRAPRAAILALAAVAIGAALAWPAAAGLDEGRDAYKRSDYGAAAAAFAASAEEGDARAMVSLGALYAEGIGVVRDFTAARRWYAAAAALGEGPSGFSFEATLIESVMPNSRSSSSTGFPGW